MPAMVVPRETTDLIETTAVSFRRDRESTLLHSASLQNPTESRQNSPFFGSVSFVVLLLMQLRSAAWVATSRRSVVRGKERISLLWISDESHDFNRV